jgi:NADH dehydrogenase
MSLPPTGATRRVATVFGGSGFIGRYVVKRLAQRGFVVRVAVRDPEGALFLKPMGAVGQIVPLYAPLSAEAAVARAVEQAEVVVNLVGILQESKQGQFDAVQHQGAGLVARLSAAAGVQRLVHLSAIGADPDSRSLYASSKGRGEAAVRAAFPSAAILRPSVVFGPEDQFFNRFGSMTLISPVMPVIAGATRFQPVYVGDVADAALAALTLDGAAGHVFELGGPRVLTFREVLQYILNVTERRLPLVRIPMRVARLQARVLERLPGKLLTSDQLILLSQDNVADPQALGLADLGITPTPIELVVPSYLKRFRKGGGKRDIFPEDIDGTEPDLSP